MNYYNIGIIDWDDGVGAGTFTSLLDLQELTLYLALIKTNSLNITSIKDGGNVYVDLLRAKINYIKNLNRTTGNVTNTKELEIQI